MLKTSRYDFSLPPSRSATRSATRATTGRVEKDCYYYYVYRKKIDPTEIKSAEDLPVPLIFRRDNLDIGNLTGSLPKLTDISDEKPSKGSYGGLRESAQRGNRTGSVPLQRKRSNSLPELKRKSAPNSRNSTGKENKKANGKQKLKPLNVNRNETAVIRRNDSEPLPGIKKSRGLKGLPDSADSGSEMVKNPLAVSLLNLTPEDGLQWSRHTTISKGASGVTEKTIEVQTKKIFKDGKWLEETLRTQTITNENGTTTTSKKKTIKDLPFDDIPRHLQENESQSPELPLSAPAQLQPITNKSTRRTTRKTAKALQPIVKDDPETFARQVLVSTNSYRKIHGAPPLQLSENLNKLAKDWAEKLAKMERMEHGDQKNIGENIYCKTSSQPWFEMSGGEVVENWYSEVEDHNYSEEPTQGYLKSGHFTQLVWKDTKEMGVAFARSKNGHMAFVVAYFSPKGNWIGEFKDKVLPPGGAQKTKKSKTTTKSSHRTSNSQNLDSANSTATPGSRTKVIASPVSLVGSGKSQKSNAASSSAQPVSPQSYQTGSAAERIVYQSSGKVDTPPNARTKRSTNDEELRKQFDSPTSPESKSNPETPDSQNSRNIVSPLRYNSRKSTAESPGSPIYQTLERSTNMESIAEDEFYEDCLKAHNYYRAKHGVQPLRLDGKLTQYAQEWADTLANKDEMSHRIDSDYGENIYMKWTSNTNYKMPGEESVDSWYEEIADYDFGKEPLDLSSGHFTQVIWSDSEVLGVGVAKSNSNNYYVVANYDPPGNYIGQFSKKVPPPL